VNLTVSSWSTPFTVSILHPLRCHSSSFCGTKKKLKGKSTQHDDMTPTIPMMM
jgi:hypothetical protein